MSFFTQSVIFVPAAVMAFMSASVPRVSLCLVMSSVAFFASSMAPDTSGVRSADQARSEALFERAIWIAEQTLTPGGHFVGKLFQGPDFQKIIKQAREHFTEVRAVKPDSSRKESIEQFIVALGRRGAA